MRGVGQQIFCGLVGGLSLFVTGCWMGWPSAFLRKLKKGTTGFTLSEEQKAWSIALMDLTNCISPIPTGYFMDWMGRKPTFMATAIVYQLSWLFIIFAKDPATIYIARMLAGIAKGMGFTVLPIYIAEVAEKEIRGALGAIFTLLLFGGTLYQYIIGPYVSYLVLNVASSTVPLIFFILCFFIPESPYFLLGKGKKEAAWKAFCFIRNRKKEDPDTNDDPVKQEMESADALVQKEMVNKTDWLELVRTRGNRRACVAVFSLSILQRLGGISPLLAYSSVTLPEEGVMVLGGPDEAQIWFGFFLTVATFFNMMLVDIWGRKPLLLLSNASITVVTLATAVFFVLQSGQHNVSDIIWIPYVSIIIFAVCFSIGIGAVPNTLLGEYFPANIKAKASAICSIFLAFASFVNNKMYPIVSNEFGYQAMFFFFSVINVLTILFTIFWVYETKKKTFAEIQEMLNT